MPTITLPGDTLAQITAGAASAATAFDSTRSNALVQIVGDQPWAYSSDNVNFFNVPAGQPFLLPYLSGQLQTRTVYFKRTGAVDSILSLIVAG